MEKTIINKRSNMQTQVIDMGVRKQYIDTLSYFAGMFLGLCSIFEPYVAFHIGSITVRITDIIIILLAFFIILRHHNNIFVFNSSRVSLVLWYFGFAIISLFGVLVSSSSLIGTYRSVFLNMVYIILFSLLWRVASFDVFKKTLYVAGTIVTVVVILQFVLGNLGIPMWDGRLPGFDIYGHWSSYNNLIISDIRPNSVFQEASYVGLYLMVALATSLKDTKYRYSILFTVALLLSASLVAIGGAIIAYMYFFIFSKDSNLSNKAKRRAVLILLFVIVAFIVLYNSNAYVNSTLDYLIRRINGISASLQGERMSSERWRLTGYIDYYKKYSPMQKLFGVGESQYYLFFGLEKGYANNFVTCILNFGLIGLIWYILGLVYIFKLTSRSSHIYFWLFLFASAVDAFWFNWHFFYAITPCILDSKVDNKRRRN